MRLSEDDGPPAHLFLEDDEEQEDEISNDGIGDIEEDASHLPSPVELQSVELTRVDMTGRKGIPPAPPPKDRT